MMTEPIIVRSGYNSGEKCHGLTVTRSNITVMSQAFGLAIFSRQLLNFATPTSFLREQTQKFHAA